MKLQHAKIQIYYIEPDIVGRQNGKYACFTNRSSYKTIHTTALRQYVPGPIHYQASLSITNLECDLNLSINWEFRNPIVIFFNLKGQYFEV